MARKPASETALQRFAALLDGHRRGGSRPATAAGEPWTYAGLAAEIPSGRGNDFVSARSASNWCKGTSLPDEIEPILRALFGPGDRHAAARSELRSAFQAARDEKAARVLAKAKPDPAGGQWVIENDQFVLDRTVRPTDARAAKDPLRRQLQAAILRHAADLAERARRVGNTRSWSRLGEAAAQFHAALRGEPRDVLQRLGEAYASLLELGSFLETDIRLQKDTARFDEPLDADIHGVLSNLVRTAAPWLRGFPTVARWDDEAGKALLRADLFQPAREFIRINRERQAIPERDADEITALTDAAETEGFQGHKAGTRAVGHATNLLLAEAAAVAASRTGVRDEAALSIRDRARSTLSAAQAQIEAFSAHWPLDLRFALRAILEDHQDRRAVSRTASLPAAVPDDVEEQAAVLILQGQSPPASWRPFIINLNLSHENLSDIAPLAGLTNLQSLSLMGTQASNIGPLAGFESLQDLNLIGTEVSDITPLASLKSLRSLELMNTQVSDIASLAGLKNLQNLDLWGTQVRDIAPLAGLTNLQNLDLWGTQVRDIMPLTGLTSLRGLDLRNTQVSNIAPLAGLINLQSLNLGSTQVSDITFLSSLVRLQDIGLRNTNIIDIAPLAGLINLRSIDLRRTQITDITALPQRDIEIIHDELTSTKRLAPRRRRSAISANPASLPRKPR